MESIAISISPGDFDRAVHAPDVLPENGDLRLCVIDCATVSAQAGVCITFGVWVNGEKRTAQAVTTLRALTAAVKTANTLLETQRRKQ